MGDILIVDDEKDIRELISEILIDEGYSTRLAGNSEECLGKVSEVLPSLLILDIWLKDSKMDGIDILKKVKIEFPHVPVVIISGHGNIQIAVSAIKQGAYDFIEKPFNIEQLLVVVRRAMETSTLRRENEELKSKDKISLELVGESLIFRNFISNLDKVSKANSRVFLTGAPGSGKETAARYIHENSKQFKGNFVSLNCSTVNHEDLEKIIFGFENTNGLKTLGALEKANGGTIFLDEVSELPMEIQGKLLKVIVENSISRVGSNKKIQVNLRFISATSLNLSEKIRNKNFREDLFHRLNVVPITIPNLNDRTDDIPILAKFFANKLSSNNGLINREFTDEALTLLKGMNWPGNIRQLKNTIERALILGDHSEKITGDELIISESKTEEFDEKAYLITSEFASLSLREAREIFERDYLKVQINRFGGNISKTAEFVEMERSALHRKLKSLGISSAQKFN
ncbi:MAG: sigma-54-dependent Fis family transcriptional regulator [Rhodobacteraceae bacterium TMED111]|nr:sigma-54-dependent Fis family transcriptional regulator [Marinovum sp.]OUV42473.1 MAG: sigma-54-dependent Fis family transcriptional regulator [Rhodobacteraceae bacterium TMED111]